MQVACQLARCTTLPPPKPWPCPLSSSSVRGGLNRHELLTPQQSTCRWAARTITQHSNTDETRILQVCRLVGRQVGRKAGICRQVGRQIGRQAGRLFYQICDCPVCPNRPAVRMEPTRARACAWRERVHPIRIHLLWLACVRSALACTTTHT